MDFNDLGFLKVACASPMVSIGAPTANATAIIATAKRLAADGVNVAVFPELCLTGYSAEDLFFNQSLLANATQALHRLCKENPLPMLVVGLPWQLADGRLLNCAAVISEGRVLGLVPKSVHPNYGEFYDLRWFVSGAAVNETIVHQELGQFQIRCDQLFKLGALQLGIEICEDLWAPHPPGVAAALAGANIIANLSASNELIAKADYRRELVRMASATRICAYLYASAGAFESSKDIVFGGHCMIAENGALLTESPRFELNGHEIVAELDLAHMQHDRSQNMSFGQANRSRPFRINSTTSKIHPLHSLTRQYPKHPFVPEDEHEFAARAAEILSIQATGLARRMRAAHCDKLVMGLSGGLDSTLAFLVCIDALVKLDLPLNNLVAITMPGPGTGKRTYGNAHRLCEAAQINLKEISIDASVTQHLADLEHAGEHDIVFENAQARERTQILFNYANKVNGIVVGTGDLSELALGWCTYNADHMASYNVNASVPKTMMAYLVRWYATHRAATALGDVLQDVLDTPISPELIPSKGDADITQRTEEIVGPYELHDFFLFHFLRTGASPTKIYHLCAGSFAGIYPPAQIRFWLGKFLRRFFSQQFKRTTLPPGPKVGSVSLSPRGDWRMPDEASAEQFIAEVDKLEDQPL